MKQMDRIDSTALFIEVAERGSFAAAARHLNRSPASVTRAVAELEARLGVRLLNRTTRAVSLTDAGARFLTGARRVLAEFDEIERAAAGEGSAPRGELRITAPIMFGRLHVVPIVVEFLRRFPDVSVALTLLDRPVDLVEERLDAALRIGTPAESSAIATRVGAVRQIVVAAPGYLRERGSPAVPADLEAHTIIAFPNISSSERWTFRDRNGAMLLRIAIKPRLIVNTSEAAIAAAMGGFGVTQVLSYQAAAEVASGALVRLLQDYEGEAWPVHLLYPGGRHPPPKLRAFLDFAAPRLRRKLDAMEQPNGRRPRPEAASR
jgi:DNA-binding transcriptional LysR family regulator